MSQTARRARGPKIRGVVMQALVVVVVLVSALAVYSTMTTSLDRRGMHLGLAFLQQEAGFDIGDKVIRFERSDTYLRAIVVGLSNTLFVSAAGIVLMLAFGTLIGVLRLSHSFVFRWLTTAYVEFFRNIPPVLLLIFWASTIFAPLPRVRQSIVVWPGGVDLILNNRGLTVPSLGDGTDLATLLTVVAALAALGAFAAWARPRAPRVARLAVALLGVSVLATVVMVGTGVIPVSLDRPQIVGLNVAGGVTLTAAFLALLSGLVLYEAAFVAEAVRAGIQSVDRGQLQAAAALGLRRSVVMRKVVLPQAMRVAIPPTIGFCIGFVKNTSLGLAVGYPDLFSVAGSTIVNQSGHAIETFTILMVVYLAISLSLSLGLNLYERHTGRYARLAR